MKISSLEPLSPKISVFVSDIHRFSTDTILLAHFSMPKYNQKCADFGTGCGAIPLIWCAENKLKHSYCVDIQKDACELFEKSIIHNGLSDKLTCVNSDLRLLKSDPRFRELDLIACNPPYKPVGTGIPCNDEGHNTARHEFSCSLFEICEAASRALRFGGSFCVCMRPERLCDTVFAFRENGIEPKRLRFVQQRPSKQPFLFLLEGKKGSKPCLSVEPVLMVEESGLYSPEMMQIYGDYKTSPFPGGGKK